MTTEQLVRNTIIAGQVAADIASQSPRDIVGALFSFGLDDGNVDLDAVERIRAGDFDDWVLAATRSGLFAPREIDALARSWHAKPRSLFEALLADADDLTRRRYENVWDSLDEADSREYAWRWPPTVQRLTVNAPARNEQQSGREQHGRTTPDDELDRSRPVAARRTGPHHRDAPMVGHRQQQRNADGAPPTRAGRRSVAAHLSAPGSRPHVGRRKRAGAVAAPSMNADQACALERVRDTRAVCRTVTPAEHTTVFSWAD